MFLLGTTVQIYIFCVAYLPILIFFNVNNFVLALDNGFTLPPHSFLNNPIENSTIVFVLGEKITLEWTTNYVEPMSLYHYQWRNIRDASRNFYVTTLLDNAPVPLPTSFVWTASPVNYSDSDWSNQKFHFLFVGTNGFGFNSQTVRIVKDEASRASISSALGTTTTPVASSTLSPTLSSTNPESPTLSQALLQSPSKSALLNLGLGLGLGLGIPLLLLILLGAYILFHKRKRIGELASTVRPLPGYTTEEKEVAGAAVSVNRVPEGRTVVFEVESGVNLPELEESKGRNRVGRGGTNGILHEVP